MDTVPPDQTYHRPVLAGPVVDLLVTEPDGIYLDCTVGGGGHSQLIANRLSPRGKLIGCDRDADAIRYTRMVLADSVALVQCRFSEIKARLTSLGAGPLSGVLMDLGVSSHQLESPARGFGHRVSGPLDLRMDASSGESAAELLARIDRAGLTRIIFSYGEDPQAPRIAKAILQERERHPITTTDDLTRIIDRSVSATRMKSLARVFQALRIAVNQELEELEHGLADTWDLLKPGGRMVVLSYHSLEDRIVKNFMREKSNPSTGERRGPIAPQVEPTGMLLFKKPLTPTEEEIKENSRAHSAKLRAIEKIS